jgi:hypothetical protein
MPGPGPGTPEPACPWAYADPVYQLHEFFSEREEKNVRMANKRTGIILSKYGMIE